MSLILVASASKGAGKTAVAAGLARRLAYEGQKVALARLRPDDGDDPSAEADARFFGALTLGSVTISEALSAAEAAHRAQ